MMTNISLIGLSISAFTSFSILIRPKASLADYLLCGLLLLICMPMLLTLFPNPTIVGFDPFFFFSPMFNLLYGPLLYFYVRVVVEARSSFTWKDSYHVLPFVLLYVLSMLVDLPNRMEPGASTQDLLEPFVFSSNVFMASAEAILLNFGVLNVLSFLLYSLAVVYALIRHQRKITNYFSRIDMQISLKWVYFLAASFLILTLLNFFNESNVLDSPLVDPRILHLLSYCSLAILLCFFGLRQKAVFKAEPEQIQAEGITSLKRQVSENEVGELSSYANKPLLDKKLVAEYTEQINHYMLADKPYLNPDFSVYALAETLDMPRRTLSFVLSSGFGKNFYQFVNNYRLEEIKIQLLDTSNKKTILDIAFDSGFSSKSTFNTLFKTHFGCTPTQFRQQVQTA